MRLITPFRIILLLLVQICICAIFGCTMGGSEVVADLGGSEVVGRLVTGDSTAVAGALVKALVITSSDSAGIPTFDTIVYDEYISNDTGGFEFTGMEENDYFLYASYGDDSLIIEGIPFSPDSTVRVYLGAIIMVAPGAISGTVVLRGTDSSGLILCAIAGTSHSAWVDPEVGGDFTINRLIPDKHYSVTFYADGYTKKTVDDIPVELGIVTEIEDTVFLDPDPDGAPAMAPDGLKAVYDTASGMATLTWNPSFYSDVKRYVVYITMDDVTTSKIVQDTEVELLIFENDGDTTEQTVLFQVAALDNANNEGPRGDPDTLVVVPPSWLKVSIDITKLEEISTIDTLYITAAFRSRLSEVTRLSWWTDTGDSLRNIEIDSKQEGTDTLLLLTSIDCKRLYVSCTDDNGEAWTDSVDARTIFPIDVWVEGDSLLEERRYAGACEIEGKIYVFGGCKEKMTMTGTALAGLMTAEVYDPAAKQWSSIAPMNVARHKIAFAVVDGYIYVFGGTSGRVDHSTVERYSPEEDRWEIVDTMPHTVVGGAACTVGDRIYLSGGITGTRDSTVLLNSIISYDPEDGSWTEAGMLKVARQLHQAVSLDGTIIFLGGLGYDERSDEVYPIDSIECFNPADNSGCMFAVSMLQTARFSFSAASAGASVVIAGGLTGTTVGQEPAGSVEVVSLEDNNLSNGAGMPAAREGAAVVASGGKVYVIGGGTGGTLAQQSTKSVFIYYP